MHEDDNVRRNTSLRRVSTLYELQKERTFVQTLRLETRLYDFSCHVSFWVNSKRDSCCYYDSVIILKRKFYETVLGPTGIGTFWHLVAYSLVKLLNAYGCMSSQRTPLDCRSNARSCCTAAGAPRFNGACSRTSALPWPPRNGASGTSAPPRISPHAAPSASASGPGFSQPNVLER